MKYAARIAIVLTALVLGACAVAEEEQVGDEGAAVSSSSDQPESVVCSAFANDRVESRYVRQIVRLESGSCREDRVDTFNGTARAGKHFAGCAGTSDACVEILCTKRTAAGYVSVIADGDACVKQTSSTLQGTGQLTRIACADADRHVNQGCAKFLARD